MASKKSDLELSRARLAKAERKLDLLLKANSGTVFDEDRLAEPTARARAEVAFATSELKLVEHEARAADPVANALRVQLRAMVEHARDGFAGIVVPPAPMLRAYSVEAVAAHVAATVAHAEAMTAAEKERAKVRLRLHAALDSVHKACALLVVERTAAGDVLPGAIVPPPPLGTHTAQPYLVPQNAAECVALLAALDATTSAPDVGRYRFDAEANIAAADRIKTDRERAERRAALPDDRQRFEDALGAGTAS